VEVRELQVNDLFALAEIIVKAGEKTQGKISKAIKAAEGSAEKDMEGLGLNIIGVLVVDSRDDILTLCGSICGMTADEFGKLNFKDLTQFVRAVKNQEGLGDFLSELRELIDTAQQKSKSKSSTPSKPDTTGQ
jgi:hypothetical protein